MVLVDVDGPCQFSWGPWARPAKKRQFFLSASFELEYSSLLALGLRLKLELPLGLESLASSALPGLRLQIWGLFSLLNHVSQFLVMHLFLFYTNTSCWFHVSGELTDASTIHIHWWEYSWELRGLGF